MMLPGLIYFILFRYLPLWNAQIAFKDFKPLLGVGDSPFVGFKNFITFFHSFYFTQLITNTVIISLLKLILGMPMAIILALCIYETAFKRLARFVQTISYLPHFLSWVIMYRHPAGDAFPGQWAGQRGDQGQRRQANRLPDLAGLVPDGGHWLGYLEGDRLEHHPLSGGA